MLVVKIQGSSGKITLNEADSVELFGGGCHGCGMAKQTLSQGMETQITAQFPEINQVVDATDHASGENPYY